MVVSLEASGGTRQIQIPLADDLVELDVWRVADRDTFELVVDGVHPGSGKSLFLRVGPQDVYVVGLTFAWVL